MILPKAQRLIFMKFLMKWLQNGKIHCKENGYQTTDALDCDGFNIVQNNGEPAGQTVFHFHMHLIPRYKGDQVGITWKPGTLTEETKKEILEKFNS